MNVRSNMPVADVIDIVRKNGGTGYITMLDGAKMMITLVGENKVKFEKTEEKAESKTAV